MSQTDATLRLIMKLSGDDKVRSETEKTQKVVEDYPASTKKAEGGFTKFKALAIGAVIAVGVELIKLGKQVVDLAREMVSLGSEAFETGGKFDTVFGVHAQRARIQIDDLAETMQRNRFDFIDYASSIQDTLVPMGIARGVASDLSVGIVGLTADVASFNNANQADVIKDFQSALVGQHQTLLKYGVVINQTTLDQELLNMGVQGGIKDATEAEKVNARLSLMYAGLDDAIGDVARTSDSFANQQRALTATIEEAKTEIGLGLLPVLLPFLGLLRELVSAVLPPLVSLLNSSLLPALTLIAEQIVALVTGEGLDDVFTPEQVETIERIATAVSEAWSEFMRLSEPIRETIAELVPMEDVLKVLAVVLGVLIVGSIVVFVATLATIVVPVLAVIAIFNAMKAVITGDTEAIEERIRAFDASLREIWAQLTAVLVEKWSEMLESVKSLLAEGMETAINLVMNTDWSGAGQAIINGIVNGMKSLGGLIASTLGGMVSGAVASAKSSISGAFGGGSDASSFSDGSTGGGSGSFSAGATGGASTSFSNQSIVMVNPQFQTASSSDIFEEMRNLL